MRWTFQAGLRVVDVDRVDTDENNACFDQVRRGLTAQVRRTVGVRGSAKMSIPAGVQEHGRTAELAVIEDLRRDSPLRSIRQPEQLEREIYQRLQRKTSKIGTSRIAVIRAIKIGPGIPSQSDHIDGELSALGVMGSRLLPCEVRTNGGRWDTRVSHQASSDGVDEVDQPGP